MNKLGITRYIVLVAVFLHLTDDSLCQNLFKNISPMDITFFEGEWIPSPELEAKLNKQDVGRRFKFQRDDKASNKLPAFLVAGAQQTPGVDIIGFGWMKRSFSRIIDGTEIDRSEKDHPFVLLAYKGKVVLFYARPKGSDPYGDIEEFFVTTIKAKEHRFDLLLLQSSERWPPYVFQRVAAKSN